MTSDYFSFHGRFGTCQVARSLLCLNKPWESFLRILKENPAFPPRILEENPGDLKNIEKVTGISVRGWLCDYKEAEVEVLLGQRAERDSCGGHWEIFGGKCDPKEMIFDALLRELDEESKLKVLFIQ